MADTNMTNQDYNIDFERIKELISKYEKKKKTGEIKKINEGQTKTEFIQPLFEALGWNVSNRGNTNDYVSVEEKVSNRRVDYGFRINGIPKFFLEAKSIRETNIEYNDKYVNQAIDYAYWKSCSWAILTNFETIAIYNANLKGLPFGYNHLFTFHPSDFLTNPNFRLLSKKAFENDEIDKIALEYGKEQFKNPIDKQLLLDMIHFREILSKDIIKNNQDKNLTQEKIDESVQRILARLIFIRNAEDRGYEENKLLSISRQWNEKSKGELVKEIWDIYKYYDKVYNSKLFGDTEPHLADKLIISDEALQEVIEGLNESKDKSYSYDFSMIEADVLGKMYEQYLGNILKATPKRAKLEESEIHRKEHGVYYTPPYIVDYIVKNTVGEYIKTHTPEEIKKLRVLDPACGSGSFLIRAYKELENYWTKELKLKEGDLRQTKWDIENFEQFYSIKTEILKNNIFGVDLDPKAVEIAQLNLLLQISEKGEKLPLLQNNIKVGNSLIDDPSITDKAFKWEEEFPEIMKEGGFDIIIGNPPYGAILTEGESNYILEKYPANRNNSDSAIAFMNRAYLLLKNRGFLSFIVPKPLIYSQKWINARKLVIDDLQKLVDVSKAFEDVLLEQVIIVVNKNIKSDSYTINFLPNNQQPISINKAGLKLFDILINDITEDELLLGLHLARSGQFLSNIAEIERGVFIQNYLKEKGDIPILRGKNIGRYEIKDYTDFISRPDLNKININVSYLKKPKIVMQNIIAHVTKPRDHIVIMATIDKSGVITLDNVGNIFIKDDTEPEFLVALLNSKLINWYAYRFVYAKAIRTMRFDKYHLSKIPLPPGNYKISPEYKEIIRLVDELSEIKLKMKETKMKNTDKFSQLIKEYDKKERALNFLIYDIFKLNKDQIMIIEESTV